MRRSGATLIEVLISMAVAGIGITGVAALVVSSSNVVRRTQARAQAQELAQRELEGLVARGCLPDPSAWCSNITALDGRSTTVWLGVDSQMLVVAPATPDPSVREYRVDLDVDPPYEGTERGFPRIERPLDGATGRGSAVNVRVTVSWLEGQRRQAAVLQTRMAP
jgi:prepilin-type N-terminal cleavage/methylation domain-containing protein